jgi:hypothetical protein
MTVVLQQNSWKDKRQDENNHVKKTPVSPDTLQDFNHDGKMCQCESVNQVFSAVIILLLAGVCHG